MKLRAVRLENFCQHRELTVEFPRGVTGILGPNGSGKSNTMKAVRFAVLGDSGNVGAKADDLNWRAAADGKSGSVELKFEKAGTEGRIKRFINNARASLTFGSVKANSVSVVNEEMAKIVGVPDRTLKDIVFVMQGTIEEVLFERPADRKKKFQGLFGTDRAERLRELLQREISALPSTNLDDRIRKLEQELASSVDAQLKDLSTKKVGLEDGISSFDRASRERVIAVYDQAARLDAQINQLTDEIGQLTRQVQEDTTSVELLSQDVRSISAYAEQHKAEVEGARERLVTLKAARRDYEMHQRLTAEVETIQKVLSRQPSAPPPLTHEQVEDGERKLAEARAALAPKSAFVAAFDGGAESAKCPTCGQIVEHAATMAAQLRAEICRAARLHAAASHDLETARKLLADYQVELRGLAIQQEDAKKRLAGVQEHLRSLGSVSDVDDAAVAALKARIDDYVEHTQKLAHADDELRQRETRLASRRSRLEAMGQQLDALREQIKARPSHQDYERAKQLLDMAERASRELSNIEGQIVQLQNRRASLLQELEALKGQAAKSADIEQYRNLCERARTILHMDCLPLMVTRAFLAGINAKLGEYLEQFNAPFGCVIKDDLSIICTIPGIGDRPAERLSGGQRTILGIAFRFAIHNLFASSLGFIVLDEPTAYLDTDRVQSVVEVLQSVRRHAHSVGTQVVVITHEPELAQAFDHTVHV